MELDHAKMYHLRYLEYEYFLDFGDILVDSESQSVIVPVVEGHDVEFEISREIAKNGPVISKMRNLQHSITLRNDNGVWKIVSDEYDDYLWRLMKNTGLSKKDFIQTDEDSQGYLPANDGTMIETTSCNLPPDQSTYPYNHSSAVEYAHLWALSPNPEYYYFPEPWGDCTNFVSQAMYEGGGALMVGSNTYGWYYNGATDHSSSWTEVQFLYDFIIYPGFLYWDAGPEGCDSVIGQAAPGDIVQYDWQNNGTWDHSTILVLSQYEPTFHWVAGHSPDVDGYPYTQFRYDYNYPNMMTRFVHIVRLDAASIVSLPLVMNDTYGMESQIQSPLIDPYPDPLESSDVIVPSPYPAPMEINEPPILSPYPVP